MTKWGRDDEHSSAYCKQCKEFCTVIDGATIDTDTSIGYCDDMLSDHYQHTMTPEHPACDHFFKANIGRYINNA